MNISLWRIGLLTLLLGAATFGCHKPVVQQKAPSDPLLVSKKPIEGNAAADPVLATRIDPQPPPVPPRHEVPPTWDRFTQRQP